MSDSVVSLQPASRSQQVLLFRRGSKSVRNCDESIVFGVGRGGVKRRIRLRSDSDYFRREEKRSRISFGESVESLAHRKGGNFGMSREIEMSPVSREAGKKSEEEANQKLSELQRKVRERVRMRNEKRKVEVGEYLGAIAGETKHRGIMEEREKNSFEKIMQQVYKNQQKFKANNLRGNERPPKDTFKSFHDLSITIPPRMPAMTRLSKEIIVPNFTSGKSKLKGRKKGKTAENTTDSHSSDNIVPFPQVLSVLHNGETVQIKSESILFSELLKSLYDMLTHIWRLSGNQTSKVYYTFCETVSKRNIVWQVMFGSNMELKKTASMEELYLMFVRFGFKQFRTNGHPRPLFLNYNVCQVLLEDKRTGKEASEEIMGRILELLATKKAERLPSINEILLRPKKNFESLVSPTLVSTNRMIPFLKLKKKKFNLITSSSVVVTMDTIKIYDILTHNEAIDIYRFIDAAKLIWGDLKKSQYEATFKLMDSGIERVNEARDRLTDRLEGSKRMWIRPFKVDPKNRLPIRIEEIGEKGIGMKEGQNEERQGLQGFVDQGRITNNLLLKEVVGNLKINDEYKPGNDIDFFSGVSPSFS